MEHLCHREMAPATHRCGVRLCHSLHLPSSPYVHTKPCLETTELRWIKPSRTRENRSVEDEASKRRDGKGKLEAMGGPWLRYQLPPGKSITTGMQPARMAWKIRMRKVLSPGSTGQKRARLILICVGRTARHGAQCMIRQPKRDSMMIITGRA